MNIKDAAVGMRVNVRVSFEGLEISPFPERNFGTITSLLGTKRKGYEIQVAVDRANYYSTENEAGMALWWFPAENIEPLNQPLEPLDKELFSVKSLLEKIPSMKKLKDQI